MITACSQNSQNDPSLNTVSQQSAQNESAVAVTSQQSAQNDPAVATTTQQTAQNESSVETSPVANKGIVHTHPAHKCTRTISHKHPNGGVAHVHRYSC